MGAFRVPGPRSFFGRFRAVPSASFANAIVVLYSVTALLGAVVYLYFRFDISPTWKRPALVGLRPPRHSKSTSSPSAWACCLPTGFAGGGRLAMNEAGHAPL